MSMKLLKTYSECEVPAMGMIKIIEDYAELHLIRRPFTSDMSSMIPIFRKMPDRWWGKV